jgi:uncharacterized membrane protein
VATADQFQYGLTLLAALGSALIGGVFFGFSTFIMRALARLPTAAGIAAMQQINVAVINPWFLVPFVGTAVAGAALAGWGVVVWGEGEARWRAVGGALYVVGTFLVTIRFNVPLNDALAAVAPEEERAVAVWEDYLVRWTWWNHVRTVAAIAAAGWLCLAL